MTRVDGSGGDGGLVDGSRGDGGSLVVPPQRWRAEAERAFDEGFTYLDWLCAVDQTDAQPSGFDVVARFLDVWTPGHWRARVLRTRVADGAALDSLTPLHAGAAWHEREAHEMFGVDFTGFEDGSGLGLRRLLLSEEFEGMPLRKSFVLAARAVRPWPGAKDPADAEGGHSSAGRRRLQAPGVPGPQWGTR